MSMRRLLPLLLLAARHATAVRRSARTWRHKGHAAGGDDDVLGGDLAAHVHAAGQAVLDGVVVNKLGRANQDVLGRAVMREWRVRVVGAGGRCVRCRQRGSK